MTLDRHPSPAHHEPRHLRRWPRWGRLADRVRWHTTDVVRAWRAVRWLQRHPVDRDEILQAVIDRRGGAA